MRMIAAIAALAALAGCGGSGGSTPSDAASGGAPRSGAAKAESRSAVALPRLPASVIRRCGELASRRSVPVLCPTRLPRARWFVRHQSIHSGRREYLTNLETRPTGSGDAFHVLAGGRSGRWPLRVRGGGWPADTGIKRDLSIMPVASLKPGQGESDLKRSRVAVVRTARVRRRPALLLRAAGYPEGGVHGGHLAVVWNQDGNGYVLSIHFAEPGPWTPAERAAILLSAAAAMSESNPAVGGTGRPARLAVPRGVEPTKAKTAPPAAPR